MSFLQYLYLILTSYFKETSLLSQSLPTALVYKHHLSRPDFVWTTYGDSTFTCSQDCDVAVLKQRNPGSLVFHTNPGRETNFMSMQIQFFIAGNPHGRWSYLQKHSKASFSSWTSFQKTKLNKENFIICYKICITLTTIPQSHDPTEA